MQAACTLLALAAHAALCAAAGPSAATSREQQGAPNGFRTLVLLDSPQVRMTHSTFFSNLAARGHELDFALAGESDSFELKKYGAYNYDNLVLFAPTAETFGAYGVKDLLDFSHSGGNMLVVANERSGKAIRRLAAECGVEYDADGSVVIDHFSHDEAHSGGSVLHETVKTFGVSPLAHVVGDLGGKPVLYKGIGHAVDEDNFLAVKILTGNPTTYSAAPDAPIEEFPENAGEDTLLVTGVQAANNARATFSGSLSLFADEFAEANAAFCDEASKWALGEKGVIRAVNVTHMRSDGRAPELLLKAKEKPDLPRSLFPDPEITRNSLVYRIKDELYYEVTMEQWVPSPSGGGWEPFHAEDVQLEFVMLDPFIRKTLSSDGRGTFSTTLVAPDTYGIFKFRLHYRRPGLSTIHVERVVSVRPFKHNEYDRYITSAYPYYATAFAMMVAVSMFSYFFLTTADVKGALIASKKAN